MVLVKKLFFHSPASPLTAKAVENGVRDGECVGAGIGDGSCLFTMPVSELSLPIPSSHFQSPIPVPNARWCDPTTGGPIQKHGRSSAPPDHKSFSYKEKTIPTYSPKTWKRKTFLFCINYSIQTKPKPRRIPHTPSTLQAGWVDFEITKAWRFFEIWNFEILKLWHFGTLERRIYWSWNFIN